MKTLSTQHLQIQITGRTGQIAAARAQLADPRYSADDKKTIRVHIKSLEKMVASYTARLAAK